MRCACVVWNKKAFPTGAEPDRRRRIIRTRDYIDRFGVERDRRRYVHTGKQCKTICISFSHSVRIRAMPSNVN